MGQQHPGVTEGGHVPVAVRLWCVCVRDSCVCVWCVCVCARTHVLLAHVRDDPVKFSRVNPT